MMKEESIDFIRSLSDEDLELLILDNRLSYKSLRNRAIKSHYDRIKDSKNIMDVYIDLEEYYQLSDKTIRNAVNGL